MNKLIKAVLLGVIVCLLGGCTAVEPPQRKPQPQIGQVAGQAHPNDELGQQVEAVARRVQGVDESTVLVINNQIAVAVKVTGFDRLHLQAIRQALNGRVENIAPEYDVHVTADKKLFAQLQVLKQQINEQPSGNIPEQIIDSYNVIIEDMNG